MTILESIRQRIKDQEEKYVKFGIIVPARIEFYLQLLEKGYPPFQDVDLLVGSFRSYEDIPDYHNFLNVFGDDEDKMENTSGVIGIDELVDVTVKREYQPLAWREAEVNMGNFEIDFKRWHSSFLANIGRND